MRKGLVIWLALCLMFVSVAALASVPECFEVSEHAVYAAMNDTAPVMQCLRQEHYRGLPNSERALQTAVAGAGYLRAGRVDAVYNSNGSLRQLNYSDLTHALTYRYVPERGWEKHDRDDDLWLPCKAPKYMDTQDRARVHSYGCNALKDGDGEVDSASSSHAAGEEPLADEDADPARRQRLFSAEMQGKAAFLFWQARRGAVDLFRPAWYIIKRDCPKGGSLFV